MSKKKVPISQTNYTPWEGHFDSMQQVDVFVAHDNVQFTHWSLLNVAIAPIGY